jgi:GWxTD domain-containing protein
MNCFRHITLLAFLVAAFIGENVAQEQENQNQFPDIPKISFDVLNFASDLPGMGRIDVYVEVSYDALHFTKEDNLFKTAYDLTIDILDSSGVVLTEKYLTENIAAPSYDESVSPQMSKLSQQSFSLSPGTYTVTVQLGDKESRKTGQVKRKIQVEDFSTQQVGMSDIMLVNRIGSEEGKKIVYPNISGNIPDRAENFYLFFEVYNRIGADSARTIVNINNIKGDLVRSDSSILMLGAEKKSYLMKIGSSQLIAGGYLLEATVTPLGGKAMKPPDTIAHSSRAFIIRWSGLPTSIIDLDVAINQLQYVTDKDTIDQMKKAPLEKRREMFRDFWKRKDPTPGTERNELMEEYFSRVAYANRHFTHYTEGWKSDMGMVYIIFGAPNNIERHPFDVDSKPYEIWSYYDLNREFIFVDATGFGDYRLQNPIWDVTRIRPR